MYRFILPLVLAMPAIAQESEDKYFYTRQQCGPAVTMIQDAVIGYNELALFSGTGLTFSVEGTPYEGGSMFFVNQDSGTWTLLTMYGDGTACITALGIDFEPYTQ